MHRLNKPSLLEDDDDDEPEFGRSSNRYLKNNKTEPKPKDSFQKELEIKIEQRNKINSQPSDLSGKLGDLGRGSNRNFIRENDGSARLKDVRTPTPRSIATDTDIEEDSGAGSLAMSGSNWQPVIKKSPRAPALEEGRHINKDTSNQRPLFDRDSPYSGKSIQDTKKSDNSISFDKWNKSSLNTESKRTSNIYDDEDDSTVFGKSSNNFMKIPKEQTFKADKHDSGYNKPKTTKFNLNGNDDEDSDHVKSSSSRIMKSSAFKDKGKTDFSIHSNPRSNKLSSEHDEDEEMSSSSKYLKTMKVPDRKEKSDLLLNSKLRNNKFNLDSDEENERSFKEKSSSLKFMKTPKEDVLIKSNPKNNKSNFNLNKDDNDEEKNSRSTKLKFHDKDIKEKQNLSFQSDNKLSLNHGENSDSENSDSENSFLLKTMKFSNDIEKDSDMIKPMQKKTSRNDDFLKTKKEFNGKSIDEKEDFSRQSKQSGKAKLSFENEENNGNNSFYGKPWNADSSKKKELNFLENTDDDRSLFPNKRESKSIFSQNVGDKISRSRKDDFEDSLKSESSTKTLRIPMKNSRTDDCGENELDFKRRSIRFEDEDSDRSEKSSRHSSPRKGNKIKKPEEKKSRSPSPVTSICEEYEKDPVLQRLDEIKQRRQDRKKQEDLSHMNSEHRIASEAIDAVEINQFRSDIPPSKTKKVTVPLNKKYQNIQSKITTKPNLKSASMTNLNDILSKIDEPNTDRNFSASQAIREAAYLEWYQNKLKELKEKKANTPVEVEETTKEKRNEEDVKATYAAWLAKKKEYFLEMKRKKEEEQKKQVENKENKDNKNSTFDLWKKMKDERKKKEVEKQKDESKKVDKEKIKLAEEKKEELRKKKSEWEIRQMKDLKMKKEKEEEEKRKEQEIKNKAEEKQMKAEMSYRMWEEKMDENQRLLTIFDKKKELLVQNRRAWRPSSNTVTSGK